MWPTLVSVGQTHRTDIQTDRVVITVSSSALASHAEAR